MIIIVSNNNNSRRRRCGRRRRRGVVLLLLLLLLLVQNTKLQFIMLYTHVYRDNCVYGTIEPQLQLQLHYRHHTTPHYTTLRYTT